MTTISLRLNEADKSRLDEICADIGMNITTLFTVYAKKVIKEGGIPFKISMDSRYSDINYQNLRVAENQIASGKVVKKTMEELEAMVNA